MKNQVRYGTANIQKARLAPITEQQIAEIAAITGENKSEAVQAAITERYMRVVYSQHEKKIEQLESQVLILEAALRDAAQ